MSVGHVDQLLGEGLGIGDGSDEITDFVVRHLVDEAVAAQDESIAANDGEAPDVCAYRRLDAKRASDDVSARVSACLLVADVAGGHELLHITVVNRHALEAAEPEAVRTRIAHVDQHEALLVVGILGVQNRQSSEGGAHAGLRAIGPCCTEDGGVGLAHSGRSSGFACRAVAQALANNARRKCTGYLAGLVSAHAIGDSEHHRFGHERVLVLGTDAARIGGRAPPQVGHQPASRIVLPIWMRSPLFRISGAVMRFALT